MAVPDIGTVCWLPIEAAMVPESESKPTRPINLAAKQTGKPTAGNPHGGFDAAGIGNGLTVRLVRHSQRKRGATDRLNLRGTAPVLDPTVSEPSRLEENTCLNTTYTRITGHLNCWRERRSTKSRA